MYSCVSLDPSVFVLFNLVVLDLVSLMPAVTWDNVSEVTYVVSSGT